MRRNTVKEAEEGCANGKISSTSTVQNTLPFFNRKQQEHGPGTPLCMVNSVTLFIFINFTGYCLFFWVKQPSFLLPILQQGDPEKLAMHLCYGSYTLFIFSLLALCSVLIYRGLFILGSFVVNCNDSLVTHRKNALCSILWTIQLIFLFLWHGLLSLFIGIEAMVYADMAVHTYEFDWIRIISDTNQQKDLGLSKKDHAWRIVTGIKFIILVQFCIYTGSKKIANRWREATDKAVLLCVILVLVGGIGFFIFDSQVEAHRYELRTALFMSRVWDPEDADMHLHPKLSIDQKTGYVTDTMHNATLPPPKDRKNFVFIVGESWRYDMLKEELMPNTMKFVNDSACFRGNHHFSSGHVTELGIFGLLYGIPSFAYHHYSLGKVPSYPLKLLENHGYVVEAIIASVPWGYPNNFVITQFPNVKLHKEDQGLLEGVQKFVDERQKDGKNFVLFLFLEDPHYPYSPSNSSFLVHKPYLAKGQFDMVMNVAQRIEVYWNAYYNAILSFDDSVRRIREMLDKHWKANQLALVLTGDHGQEMVEHGNFGHAGNTFWNEKTRVALFVCIPGEENRIATAQSFVNEENMITSHIDVWPTLFDGANIKINVSTWTTGISLFDPSNNSNRTIEGVVVSGRHFPQLLRPNAVITRACKFWFVYTDRSYTTKKIIRITDYYDNNGCLDENSANTALATFDEQMRRVLEVELDPPKSLAEKKAAKQELHP